MTTFIDSSGRLVRGSPPLTLGRALQLPAEFLWAVLGFVTLFFSSCFGVARAGQKTSASGGRVVRKGGPGGFGGGGARHDGGGNLKARLRTKKILRHFHARLRL